MPADPSFPASPEAQQACRYDRDRAPGGRYPLGDRAGRMTLIPDKPGRFIPKPNVSRKTPLAWIHPGRMGVGCRCPLERAWGSGSGGASAAHGFGEESVNQFKRELNLSGSPGGMINDPEARTAHDVHGRSEGHQVEGVEELGTELNDGGLRTRPAAQSGVFDQCH